MTPEAPPPDAPPYFIVPACHEPLIVRHRDAHCIVVEKPAFLLSVPGRGPENRDSAAHRLLQDEPETRVVHRLDLDTSGLMVFAVGIAAQRVLNKAFAERQVEKEYIADVDGLPDADQGEITLPIAPDWANRPRQRICHERGKQALTRYTVISRDAGEHRSRLLLRPVTGRSHQLRIHLKEIGHAILGCDLYAPPDVLARSPRLHLHASKLGFHHPASGEWLHFSSPAPF
ncbi:RNA pseudouridine synthase [Alcanivorax sp. JB21]|uniref:RluA family pseudouridine synthase n=1 Tax=Alcanivorax limicola TaxID=2874102 RepID=UPI001CBFA420|nr:pseudouridine synthase [Alcanivorax limicola]MBZ2187965.1 RNA pseudouridine synthase [Alcanivorax limicola]